MRNAIQFHFLLAVVLVAASCGGSGDRTNGGVSSEEPMAGSNMEESPGGVDPAADTGNAGSGEAGSDGRGTDVVYIAEEEPSVSLTLKESPDGAITGTLAEAGMRMSLAGRRNGSGFTGSVDAGGEALPVTARVTGESIVMQIGEPGAAEQLTFRRSGRVAEAADSPHAGSPESAAGDGRRHVVINGRRLGDAEVAQAEQMYRIRIPDADYWYDRTLGAWGVRGGPTMGFIAAGLDLGGALRPDASGGGTSVFANGRELHPYDLAALQRITGPIVPGRYFITAQGLAGYEGGPPMWNLAAMATQSQGGGGGGSNTWQSRITGASGFSDGTTGAVFLPNGGIVSTGG